MVTEYIWVIQILATIATGVMGWFLRTLWARIHDVEAKLAATRETYVHKDDLQIMKTELLGRLGRIEDLLHHILKKGGS